MRKINLAFALIAFCVLLTTSVPAQVGKKGEPAPQPSPAKNTNAPKKSTTPAKSSASRTGKRTNSARGNAPASKAVEMAYWDSVKNSTNPEDFRAYLRKYPNGEFVDLAKNRIASLESVPTEEPAANKTSPESEPTEEPAPDKKRQAIGSAVGAIIGKASSPPSGAEFIVPDGATLVAKLNNDLSTKTTMEGDRFTMTVVAPSQYEGATVEGSVLKAARRGRVTGRAQLALNFETIRLRGGRTYHYAGTAEAFRTPDGLSVRVDDGIAYIEGRDDLELGSNTEVTIRTGVRN